MKKEYVQEIADRLIEQIKTNKAPWQKPWQGIETSNTLPINLNTNKPYRGMNLINLMSVAEAYGYKDNRWITYKGAEKLGAQVRKGERATNIHYWKFTEEVTLKDEDGKPVLDKEGKQVTVQKKLDKPRVFFANVFNAEQIDGLPPKEQTIKVLGEWERHQRAEEILEASGVKIRHKNGDSAYYKPREDEITLPLKKQFPTADGYYVTALHELGHATGHPSRLNRDLSGGFGSENYAKEELRAEMASLFIGQELQIGHDPGQHFAYLKHWVNILEDDPKEIFRAARDADLITSYVLDLSKQQTLQTTETLNPDIENAKQIFLLRQDNPELDNSIKSLNKLAKKAGLSLHLKVNDDKVYGSFAKGGQELPISILYKQNGQLQSIFIEGKEQTWSSDHDAKRVINFAINPFKDAIATTPEAKKLIAKFTSEEEKLQQSSFSDNFQKLTKELENQFSENGVAAIIDVKKIGNNENLKVSYVGKDNDLHHYSTNLNEKGFLSIAFNGVEIPSSNTASVSKHLGDIVTASLAYTDLFYAGRVNSDETLNELRSFNENTLGDSPLTTWNNLSQTAKQNGLFARIAKNQLPNELVNEDEREQQPKFIVNYADQDNSYLDVKTLIFENGKAVTLRNNEEYDPIQVTSDPISQGNNLITLVNAELNVSTNQPNLEKTYIDVGFGEKEEAKQLGAKWDSKVKGWYVPAGIDLASFSKWKIISPEETIAQPNSKGLRNFINVPISEKEEAKQLGAKWDRVQKSWYIPEGVDIKQFDKWNQKDSLSESPTPKQIDLEDIAPGMKDQIKHFMQEDEVISLDQSSQNQNIPNVENTYLYVGYEDRQEAKDLGAKWDTEAKSWYVPAGLDIEPFEKWMPHNQNHVDLPDTSKSIRPQDEFKTALMQAGLMVQGEPLMDGKMHRVPVEGDKKGQLGGAYKGYLDGRPAGYIRNFRTGLEEKWKSNSSLFNVVDMARMRAEAAQKRANEEKRLELLYEKNADQAAMVYAAAEIAHEHPYLSTKGIHHNEVIKIVPGPESLPKGCEVKIANNWQEAKQLREINKQNGVEETILTKGDLLIPGYNAEGKLMMLQTINPTGFKGYMKNAKKSGSFTVFGELKNGEPFLLAEGVATAATLHEHTNRPVVAAFDSGNLINVARDLRDKYHASKIYIAADNDHQAEAKNRAEGKNGILNPGVEFAFQAAEEISGYVLTPKFNKADPGSDWNDIFMKQGEKEFKQQLQAELNKAKSLEQTAKISEEKLYSKQNELSKRKDDKQEIDMKKDFREAMKLKR